MSLNTSSGTPRLIFGLPESVIDFLIPIVLNLLFIVIAALVLWPMGKTVLAFQLAKGLIVFWVITFVSVVVVAQVQRLLHISSDSHEIAFVISNLIHGMFLVVGWSAFASIVVHEATAGAGTGAAVVLWIVGIFSSAMAYVVITTFHRGSIYTLFNVLVTTVSLVICGVWPAMAHTTYGWFFNLFR